MELILIFCLTLDMPTTTANIVNIIEPGLRRAFLASFGEINSYLTDTNNWFLYSHPQSKRKQPIQGDISMEEILSRANAAALAIETMVGPVKKKKKKATPYVPGLDPGMFDRINRLSDEMNAIRAQRADNEMIQGVMPFPTTARELGIQARERAEAERLQTFRPGATFTVNEDIGSAIFGNSIMASPWLVDEEIDSNDR